MHKKKVVIIAEKRVINSNMDMYSNELDFSSKRVTTDIINNVEELGYDTFYYENPKNFLDNIDAHKDDIVFANLWGGYHSRNKRALIPAICEAYDISYIGADAYVQSLCQDKYLTKKYLDNFKYSIPKAVEISSLNDFYLLDSLNFYPCVVKPNDEGCSVGISSNSLVNNAKEAKEVAFELLKHYTPIIIEEFISGDEISICCAGTNKSIKILEAIKLEINGESLKDTVWGYETKKMGKKNNCRKNVTKSIPYKFLEEASVLFSSMGKVDCMRIDGKLFNDKFYVIELSPDCSLHKECFMASAFSSAGYTYPDMLNWLINNANT